MKVFLLSVTQVLYHIRKRITEDLGFWKNTKEANKILKELDILKESGAFAAEIEIVPEEVVEVISKKQISF